MTQPPPAIRCSTNRVSCRRTITLLGCLVLLQVLSLKLLLLAPSRPATSAATDGLRAAWLQCVASTLSYPVETVINDAGDLLCLRRLEHLDELQARARAVNDRLLDTERVGQGCVLASPAFERVAQSTPDEDGRGRRHYGSEVLGSWPCSAPCASG